MQPPATPTFSLAPGFAARLALITASLIALIARGFLRNPALVPLIIPLHKRLTRTARRFAILITRLAEGRLPSARPAGTSGPHHPGLRMPTGEAWLVTTLGHEAAGFASQLRHLLAEPGMPELLAATPSVSRLLRPLCRMLGISGVLPPPRAPAEPTPAAIPPPPQSAPPPLPTVMRPAPCPHLQLRWPWFSRVSPKAT